MPVHGSGILHKSPLIPRGHAMVQCLHCGNHQYIPYGGEIDEEKLEKLAVRVTELLAARIGSLVANSAILKSGLDQLSCP